MRVHQIAKLAGVTSKDVMQYIEMLGLNVKSASSKVEGEIFINSLVARLVATRDEFIRPYLTTPF